MTATATWNPGSTTTLPGLIQTEVFDAHQRPKNYRASLLRLRPDTRAVLTALSGLMKSNPTDDPEFYIFEKRPRVNEITATANKLSSDTTITVDDASMLKAGYILRNQTTDEILYVTADPASPYTSLDVTRGDNVGSTSAAITNGDKLTIVATSYSEASSAPLAISRAPSTVKNYTQIFRTPVQISGTAMQTALRYAPAGNLKEQKRDALEDHYVDLETQALFGVPWIHPTATPTRRTTGGFYHFVEPVNSYDFDGTVTASTWRDATMQAFRRGSSRKLCLAGAGFLQTISDMAMTVGQVTITPNEKIWGMNVTTVLTPFGELVLKHHPLLTELTGHKNDCLMVDTKYFRYRPLRGRDTSYRDAIQNKKDDEYLGEYFTEGGFELGLPEVHMVIRNAAAFSA